MSGQYFENNKNLASKIVELPPFYFKGKEIYFYSNNGVFSKNRIDFGSNLLLKNIVLEGDEEVLDVGCGYGTLGVSLAKTNPNIKITMVDVNERAIALTLKAIDKNELKNAECFISNIYEKIDKQFNLIISNPPIRAGKIIVHTI